MANFRNTIKIKELFEDYDHTESTLQQSAQIIHKRLNTLINIERSRLSQHTAEEINENQELSNVEHIITHYLEEISENFSNLSTAIADGEEADEYGFDSYEEWFDGNLQDLYEVADSITHSSDTVTTNRFLFVA